MTRKRQDEGGPDRRGLLRLVMASLGLVALAAVVYIPAMNAGFIWDDDLLLTDNQMIRSTQGLRDFWFTVKPMDYFPLTSTTLWVEWRLWGLNAAGYHVINVILHALSALAIWRILLRLRVPGAYLAAAVFAVHPVTVASVAWIAERKNTLSMLFYAVSVLAFLRFEDSRKRSSYVLALVAFLLALLSKTSVVMMPAAMLVLAWWRRGRISKVDIRRSIPFFVMSLALGLVTVYYQYHAAIGQVVVRSGGFLSRLAGSGWCVWFYLYKALLPVRLSMIYPLWDVDPRQPVAWLPLLGLVAVIGLALRCRSSWGRPLLVATAYFVVMLLPVLGFFNMSFYRLSLVSDHLQYAGLIGPIALVVGAVTVLGRRSVARKWMATAVACIALALLATLTWQRAGVFASQYTLWQDTIQRNPEAWIARIHLGLALLEDDRPDEAVEQFNQALELKPDHVGAHVNLGDALGMLGRTDEAVISLQEALRLDPGNAKAYANLALVLESTNQRAEALKHYERALEIDPDLAEVHSNFGNALSASGRLTEAVSHYRRALNLKPELSAVYFNLGSVLSSQGKLEEAAGSYREGLILEPGDAQGWCDLGVVRGRQGRVDEAIEHFRQALANDPQHASAHYNLGISLQGKGRPEEAIEHYRQAMLSIPNSVEVHYSIGMALAATGDYAEALENLRFVLEERPDDPLALNTIAWLLATVPDGGIRQPEEAVRLAERAAELTGRKAPEILDTLAAAYAASGDYPKALAEAQAAVELALALAAHDLAADIGTRVDLYRQSRPYVGP
ncbi:MAG: tetratricopeptide repeat protein [Candidatus Eisenbacteria bacterium]